MCEWEGDANHLYDAMKTCGFIRVNPQETTGFVVHDWDNVNASLLASWRNGARGGRQTYGKATGYPQVPHGQPTPSNHILKSTDKTRRVTHGKPTGFQDPELTTTNPEGQKKTAAFLRTLVNDIKSGKKFE